MALNIAASFPGKSAVPSAAYPFGSAQDVTTPGAGNGTPLVADIYNDLFGMQQSLLSAAGLTANGLPDSVSNPQYKDAILLLTLGALSAPTGADNIGVSAGGSVEESLNALTVGQTGGLVVFTTKVLLDAFTPTGAVEEASSYKVTNDPTSSNNGFYNWNGASFDKDAELVVNVADVNNTSDAVSGKAVSDKFNDFKVGFLHTFTDNLIIDTLAGTIEAPSDLFLVVNGSFTTVPSFIQKSFVGGAAQSTAVHFLLWTGSTLEVVLFTEIGTFDRDDTVLIGTIGATPSVNCDVIFNGDLLRSNAGTQYTTDLPEFTQASILHAATSNILTINLLTQEFTIGAGFLTTQQGFIGTPSQVDIPFILPASGLNYVMYDTDSNEVKIIGFSATSEFTDSIKLGSFFLTGTAIITSEFNLPVKIIGTGLGVIDKIKILPFDGYVNIDTSARTIEVTDKIFLATDSISFVEIGTTAPRAWDSTQSDESIHYIMYNVADKVFDVVDFSVVSNYRASLFVGVINKPIVSNVWTVNIDGTITVDGIEAGNAVGENRFSTKQAFFFGDSITFGFPDGTYIDKVVEIVEPGGFTNFGSNGATTGRLVAIMTPAPDRQGSDSFSLPDYSLAAFCTIMIGTNGGVSGTVADISSFPETCFDVPYSTFTTIELHLERYPDSYYGNLALILDYITFANKEMEIFLIDAPVEISAPNQHLEIRSALNEIHPEFAVKRILACNEAGITLRSGINSGFLNVDGTHLTVAGTDKWGTHLGYELKKYR